MAKEEYEMPQSDSDVESESGEEDRKSDKSDNEREYDDDNDDGEPEKLSCNHCGKETGHIVYLMKCPRCSWKDFYWGKNV
jgi:DNA-directed RNA polymerase subunit RPC12/RpoP